MSLPQNDTSSFNSRESNVESTLEQTTCCALLTGTGRAAIAVVELWGQKSNECLAVFFRPASQHRFAVGQIRYGTWIDSRSSVPANGSIEPDAHESAGESIVVVPVSSDRFEIHCHGGNAAIGRIMDDLACLGVAQSQPNAASALADSQSSDERITTEACERLLTCTTANTAAIVLDQVRGALVKWRNRSIDALVSAPEKSIEIAAQATEIASAGKMGVRLDRPFDVVLAGPPNVGKSSLINAMVGFDRSITMDVAGTTRDVLDAETVFDGWPLRLRDTAGLHSSDQIIEQQGIQRALDAIRSADLAVLVTQPDVQLDQGQFEQVLFEKVLAELEHTLPVLHVLNKSDLSDCSGTDVIKTVATTGQGVPELLCRLTEILTANLPPHGAPVPINDRQLDWVSELVLLRDSPEQMLETLRNG